MHFILDYEAQKNVLAFLIPQQGKGEVVSAWFYRMCHNQNTFGLSRCTNRSIQELIGSRFRVESLKKT